jgi:hypothetical protein
MQEGPQKCKVRMPAKIYQITVLLVLVNYNTCQTATIFSCKNSAIIEEDYCPYNNQAQNTHVHGIQCTRESARVPIMNDFNG